MQTTLTPNAIASTKLCPKTGLAKNCDPELCMAWQLVKSSNDPNLKQGFCQEFYLQSFVE